MVRVRIEIDDGVKLEVEFAGSGPGLMLVHGFGGAKEDFADHVPALAERPHRGRRSTTAATARATNRTIRLPTRRPPIPSSAS